VIGFCMGGGFALLLAPRPGWSAASVNYGPLPDDLDDALAGSCAIVASYGGADRSLRGAARQLETALTAAGVPHDVKEYPGAGHVFMNREAVASPLNLLMRVVGVGYQHPAAEDARRRILAFFDTHLRQVSP
jgi:carboxymethylenebutenolidase